MTSLGNIALSLKDRVMSLKSDYNVYFSLSSSFFGSKSFLRLVLLLTRLLSSSSDVGVKNLANSLTWEGPMHLRGSSWMSCNLSVSESLLLRGALAFSACTCFLDPLSLGRLRGYGGSGMFATGGTETGLGWFCGWHGNLLQYGDMLLLVSQIVHLTAHHSTPLLISGTCEQGVDRALHLKHFWWCRPWCTGWTAGLWAWSVQRWLWAALGWCLSRRYYQCHWYWCSLHLSFQRGSWAKKQKTH